LDWFDSYCIIPLYVNKVQMRKEQIIRRKAVNGRPIGPYMRITAFPDAHHVETADISLLRKNVYQVKVAKLVISDNIFNRIADGRQSAIIHDMCPRWKKLLDNIPEVIQFRSEKYSNKTIVFSIECVRVVYYGCERIKQLRLQLAEHINV